MSAPMREEVSFGVSGAESRRALNIDLGVTPACRELGTVGAMSGGYDSKTQPNKGAACNGSAKKDRTTVDGPSRGSVRPHSKAHLFPQQVSP